MVTYDPVLKKSETAFIHAFANPSNPVEMILAQLKTTKLGADMTDEDYVSLANLDGAAYAERYKELFGIDLSAALE